MKIEPQTVLHGRYRVDGLLGHGGMGAVYRAFDLLFDRPCALKEFSPKHLADIHPNWLQQAAASNLSDSDAVTLDKAIKLFKREAKLLATLDHPNLPKVSDYFSLDDDYYLVMTLIEGKDLKRMQEEQQGKPFEEQLVMGWMEQVMDALGYCHQQGIVHRDVKPANIIVTLTNRVYLVDFGVAKLYDPSQITTGVTQVLTPRYSAPEQYTGGTGLMDARVDIYSLGATMYTLLTGTPPLDAVSRLMKDNMPSPRQLISSISASVDFAVTKAMALAPQDRFSSIEEMRKALAAKTAPMEISSSSHQAAPEKEAATVLYDRFERKAQPPQAVLQLRVEALGEKMTYTIHQPNTRLGRSSSSRQGEVEIDLTRFDQKRVISRYHASIELKNNQYYLVDHHSHNGTWLNGIALTPETPYPLHNGDKIQLGSLRPYGIQIMFTLASPSP